MLEDKIPLSDWRIIQAICTKLTECYSSLNNSSNTQVSALINLLDQALSYLFIEYGETSSILSTRAEFISQSIEERVGLLSKAIQLAEENREYKNLVLASSALCELFFEEVENVAEGRKGLQVLREALKKHPDRYYLQQSKNWSKQFMKSSK